MAGDRRIDYTIGIDAGDATGTLRTFSRQVAQAMSNVEDELDEGATAGDKLAAAIDDIGSKTKQEFAAAANAADKLGDALKRADSSLDVSDVLPQLQRLGLTFDEIADDADKLAVSLKQLDDVKAEGLDRLDKVAPNAAKGLDDLNVAADKGQSVAANAYGNIAQDIGELGGISGTAGVALGQMGEYAADAFYQTGNLKQALTGVAAAAGPMAAVTIVLGLVMQQMAQLKAAEAFDAKVVEDWADAIAKGGDAAESLRDIMVDTGKLDFSVAKQGLGAFGQETRDITEDLDRAGITYEEFVRMAEAGVDFDTGSFHNEFDPYERSLGRINDALGDYRRNEADAAEQAQARAVALGYANAETMSAVEGWRLFTEELSSAPDQMPAQWDAVVAAVERLDAGLEPTAEQVSALADITARYGVDAADVYDEVTTRTEEAAQAAADHAVAVGDAQAALADIADQFAELDRRRGALADLFTLGNAPLDALGDVQDLEQGLRDFATWVRGPEGLKGVIPDIFDPDDVNADDFLAQIETLRGPIQAAVADAFAAGGPEAATQVADNYVDRIVEQLAGALTADEVRDLLGLGDLTAQVQVALDMSTAARVRAQLDVLTGIAGNDPLTASVMLALDAGELSPEAAEQIVRDKLGDAGVSVPLDPTPPTGAAVREAYRFLQEQADANAPTVTPTVNTGPASTSVEDFAAGVSGRRPTVTVDADTDPGESSVDDLVTDTDRRSSSVGVNADTALAAAVILSFLTRPRTATVAVDVDNALDAERRIDHVARDRVATVSVRTIEDTASRWWRVNGRFGE
jgi:methyl-accepting chemotaxis protein